MLLSSHILTEISQTCDRLLVIKDGALVDEGTESELANKHGAVRRSLWVSVVGPRAAVEAALRGAAAVAAVEYIGEVEGAQELRVDLAEGAPEAVAKLLVEGGFGVRRLEPVKSELEGTFLRLTGAKS